VQNVSMLIARQGRGTCISKGSQHKPKEYLYLQEPHTFQVQERTPLVACRGKQSGVAICGRAFAEIA
jgi:hypothetical protein